MSTIQGPSGASVIASARDSVVDLVIFGYAVLAAGATVVKTARVGTAMLVVDSALAAVACRAVGP